MTKTSKKLLSILLLLFSINSYAILDIEITNGIDSAVPVAIYPFNINLDNSYSRDNIDMNKLNIVYNVIAHDLYRSGLFTPKIQSDVLSNVTLNALPITKLQEQQIEYLVKGNIVANANGKYKVSVELIDVYQLMGALTSSTDSTGSTGSNSAARPSNKGSVANQLARSVLIDSSFEAPQEYLRNLAHHISDIIYERLTGIKGVFSSRIAYVNVVTNNAGKRQYVLEVADSDGYNSKPLLVSSEPIMSPAWSPSGKEIAYVSFLGNRSKINIVQLNSGNTRTVTAFKGINGAPSWSPDGSKMALVLSHEQVPKIYVLNLANNKLTQLTTGSSIDTEPRWSPDGKSLVFTSNRSGGPQIYKFNFDDNKITRLTYDGNYNARASFTPDGKKLIMVHRSERGASFNIAVQDLTTFNLDILTRADMDESPSISANGQQIIYATKEGNKGILAEVSIDGRVKIKRPAQIGDVQEPAWSPYMS
jgi:TolB protein